MEIKKKKKSYVTKVGNNEPVLRYYTYVGFTF